MANPAHSGTDPVFQTRAELVAPGTPLPWSLWSGDEIVGGDPASPDLVAHCDFCGGEDEANAAYIVHAANCFPELVEALQLCIPANVCLTNSNVPDSMIVPLDVPLGDLRKIAAVLAKAVTP